MGATRASGAGHLAQGQAQRRQGDRLQDGLDLAGLSGRDDDVPREREVAVGDAVIVRQGVVDRLDPLLVVRTVGRAVRAADGRCELIFECAALEGSEQRIDIGGEVLFRRDDGCAAMCQSASKPS